jgi:hypothetical protein
VSSGAAQPAGQAVGAKTSTMKVSRMVAASPPLSIFIA